MAGFVGIRQSAGSASLVASLIFLSFFSSATASDLSAYRWKQRILLVSTRPEQAGGVAATLKRERPGLLDRDLIVIDLSTHRKRIPNTIRPTAESIDDLRQRYSMSGQDNQFILLGKDGGVKARQSETLDLNRFFTQIDAMPMRQEEMRRNR